jgi:Lysozyme like domain
MIAEVALAAVVHLAPACTDRVVNILHSAGFRGQALHYAYGIVMRESKGHARAISPTSDYGLFQFNRAAWSSESWWHSTRLLEPAYNAAVAWRLSQGGRTFYPWDINGRGQHLGRYSTGSTYRVFVDYVKAYPC